MRESLSSFWWKMSVFFPLATRSCSFAVWRWGRWENVCTLCTTWKLTCDPFATYAHARQKTVAPFLCVCFVVVRQVSIIIAADERCARRHRKNGKTTTQNTKKNSRQKTCIIMVMNNGRCNLCISVFGVLYMRNITQKDIEPNSWRKIWILW